MEPMELPSHAVFQPQKRLFDAINEKRDFLGQSQVRTDPNTCLIISLCMLVCFLLVCCFDLLLLFAVTVNSSVNFFVKT